MPRGNEITRTNLRQRVSNNCEAYHAGMTAGRRKLVQQQFMSGMVIFQFYFFIGRIFIKR